MSVLWLKKFSKKSWLWVRQNVEIVLGLIIVLGVFLFLSRGKKVDFKGILDAFRKRHKKELESIEREYERERKDQERAAERLASTLRDVEKAYDDSQKELTRKKKRAVEKAIKENQEDPDALTRRIAELTGMTVVVSDNVQEDN